MKKNHLALLCLSATVFLGSCTKDPVPNNYTTTTNNTTTTGTTGTVPGVDYSLDTSVRLNYTVMLVNGTEYSVGFGKTNPSLAGASVSISQAGTTKTKLTDDNGMAAFVGFFKGVLTVSISKDDLTAVKYLVTVNSTVTTVKAGKIDVANIIPVFKIKNDPLTASIIGKVTFENDLTNSTREIVPAGTKILASIDASSVAFYTQYLKVKTPYILDSLQSGKIINFAYQTAFYDSTDASGNYKITIPGSVDGLPFIITAPDLSDNQKYYENASVAGFNQVKISRTIFSAAQIPTVIPPAGGASVTFLSGSGATATASVSGTGQVDKINITSGGSGYTAAPRITISGGGGGSGATATAIITNGVVTSITINSGGSGYTSNPTVSITSFTTQAQMFATLGGGGSIIDVQVQNSGAGYTTAPNVTISAPSLPGGVNATATANISGSGMITTITVTNAGSGYTSNPSVTIAAAPSGGTNATAIAQFSGQGIQSVFINNSGLGYTGVPTITFSAPDILSGTRAQGTATIDPNTGAVIGFTLTNAGSGYLLAPTVTISAGSGASAVASYSGQVLTGITVNTQGQDYSSAPKVVISGGGGTGAVANAIVLNGRVVGFTITNPGSGYISTPTVQLVSGSGAQASVVVSTGGISTINLVNGGSGYTGPPTLVISPNPSTAPGSGATATATVDVASGAVTGITITTPGTGYLGGNVPSVAAPFSLTPSSSINAKSGMIYIKDVYYGTGLKVN